MYEWTALILLKKTRKTKYKRATKGAVKDDKEVKVRMIKEWNVILWWLGAEYCRLDARVRPCSAKTHSEIGFTEGILTEATFSLYLYKILHFFDVQNTQWQLEFVFAKVFGVMLNRLNVQYKRYQGSKARHSAKVYKACTYTTKSNNVNARATPTTTSYALQQTPHITLTHHTCTIVSLYNS